MNEFSGKTALITGASRGIGAAIFRALGEAGCNAVGTATSAAGAAGITDAAAAAGFNGKGVVYDATAGQEDVLLQHAGEGEGGEGAGGVDILVLNAAINADGLLLRLKPEDWERVIQTNLTAAFKLSQAAMRAMLKKRWGRVIFISSVVASTGNAGQANYCAAKAGLEGYCRAMARETAPRGVTVNAIAPGFIETDMTAKLPESVKTYFMNNIPAGRAGQPDDVAAAARYLASAGAAYITGQTLHVNGGMFMQ